MGSPFQSGPIEEYHRSQEQSAATAEARSPRTPGLVIDDAVAIVSEAEFARDQSVYEKVRRLPRMPGFEVRPAPGGPGEGEGPKMSHAWAVSGTRSVTGKPILESDPQLTLCSPPFFYEFHLVTPTIDARGLGIPGCPGLFIGWNRHVAWGASALGVDSHVVFLDRLSPDGRGFIYEGETIPFERRLERIEVKGGAPVVQEVLTSRHGTVFNSLVRSARPGEAYLLYDAQTMDAGASARMMLEVLEAKDWPGFKQAMAWYYYPGLHVVYADAAGNVGYHTMVHRPLTDRSPRIALEGWTGRQEVAGRIPFEELPHLLNPESGFVSHANNLPVGSWYPYDLGLATGGTGDTSRSLRLRQLLAGSRRFSLDDFEAVLHRDDYNPAVGALLPVARKVVEEDQVTDAAVLNLLDAVRDWDLHAGTAWKHPAARSLENTLTPYRGSGLQNVYGAGGGGATHLAREVGAAFARTGRTPTNNLVRAYLVNWLRASAAAGGLGRSAEGAAPRGRAGMVRNIRIPYQSTTPHNLPPVDQALDLQSPPLTCLDQGTIWSQPGNLYSQIVDLADVDNSRAMIAPGNAEDGPWRTNQVDVWVRGTTRPAPLSRTRLESPDAKLTRLSVLIPGPLAAAPSRVVQTNDARFVPAIPAPSAAAAVEPSKPLPGRRPDDPQLEAAFRTILRAASTPQVVDEQIETCRRHVKGDADLTSQLRLAAELGIYLIEESAAGRLLVSYGSPHALERLKTLQAELAPPAPSGTVKP